MIQGVKTSSHFSPSWFFLPQHDVFEIFTRPDNEHQSILQPPKSLEGLCSSSCVFFSLSLWWEKHLWKQLELHFVWSKLEFNGDIQLRTGETRRQTDCMWICHYRPKLNYRSVKVEIKNNDWLDSVHPLTRCYLETSPHFSVKSSSSLIP